MRPLSRRRALHVAGVGLTTGIATTLAGCLSRSDPGGDPNGDDDTEDPDSSGTTDSQNELVAHESVQFGTTDSRPDWFEEIEESVGDVVVIDSGERAEGVWESDDADRHAGVADFLDETSFDESVVLAVESVGPNTCTDTIEFEDVALAGGELTATASVVSAAESDGDIGCGQTITYPSALLRATFSSEPVTDATIAITDGWGNETAVTADADESRSSDLDPAELPGYVRPHGDPDPVPATLECDDEGVERLTNWLDDEIAWGVADGEDGTVRLALRVDQRTAEYGETVQITMTNVSDETQVTGNRHKYSLEVYTETGWEDVRVVTADRSLGYTDEGIGHDPGEGFEWTFDLTESGIVADHVHERSLEVCPELQAGRYRFVYWEPALAVAFDVTT